MITSKKPEFKHILLKNKLKIAVLGGGSWATALIKILTENKRNVGWYIRSEKNKDFIEKHNHNPSYLTSTRLKTKRLKISIDINTVVEQADIIIVAIPSAFIMNEFAKLHIPLNDKIIISAVKGVIPENMKIPGNHFHEDYGVPLDRIGVICGPCHAEEVAMEKLSYLTIACPNEEKAEDFSKFLDCRYIKTSTSDDLFGTEMCAVLKNIYAVAAGICNGLGYGDNFQALLISNSIREAETFIDAVSPTHRDVKSSAYLGDLLVTAYSQFSRNRNFGSMIGKGYSVRSAQIEMNMVAEGYYAVKSIVEINKKFNVELPIIDSVYRICYDKIAPFIEMEILTDKLS